MSCEIGAGSVYKSALVQSRTKVPYCWPIECKTPIMLQEGHCYENNAPITLVDPEAMDNVYRPWAAGDGWAHSAVLTCSRNTEGWTEPCEVFAIREGKAVPMEAIHWPEEGRTEAEMLKVRATSPCCWSWRSIPKPNTQVPCPADCAAPVKTEGAEK